MTKYFSTFTGIGGLDWGLESRGAECVGYSEIKRSSVDMYQRHYPTHSNFGDITTMDFHTLPNFDILTGGFPCQSFSLAGLRKGLNDGKDKKGAMVLYLYKLLEAKKPKYFVLENVKGILSHDKGKTFVKIFKVFEAAGYYVKVVLLNSLYYGSPQSRERVLFLGSRDKVEYSIPEIVDDSKRFKDVVNINGEFKEIKDTDRNKNKIEQLLQFNFELIGSWDRVGTLTTQMGCGEKVVQWGDKFRMLTPVECERLQGFSDGWTEGGSLSARYFALGNAVNCNVSEYLFNSYLDKVWEF